MAENDRIRGIPISLAAIKKTKLLHEKKFDSKKNKLNLLQKKLTIKPREMLKSEKKNFTQLTIFSEHYGALFTKTRMPAIKT